MNKNKSTWQNDLPASLVVFLVALPLCLGVGLASTNVPSVSGLPSVFSGLIAGIIGGIVVGFFSKSKIGVSGPAAGLITIVIAAITTLGSFEAFLVAVVFAGILQIAAGFLKLGILANYFPSSVIKGMLAAIGITLLLKEFPHAIGYDKDFFGDESFFQNDGHNTFSELLYAMNALHPGSIIISCVSIVLLLLFERPFLKKIVVFKFLPSALFVVVIGVLLNMFFAQFNARFAIQPEHLVQLPVVKSISEVTSLLVFPDFSFLSNPNVYIIGATIALVGSLETLLSVEATDKLDPMKNHTPTNRELKAQGIGNIVSGLLGGLPITQVVVRSSANINAGGESKISTIVHGLLLLIAVLFLAPLINKIPLASLAAILIMVGYKLAKVKLFKQVYKQGLDQFIPFVVTIVAVLMTDLLKGILAGIVVSIFYILKRNYKNNFKIEHAQNEVVIKLSEEVTFLNKSGIFESLNSVQPNTKVVIDGTKSTSIDFDVLEIIQEFKNYTVKEKNIELILLNIPEVVISSNH
jgi:carbonic anhydrase